MADEVKNVESIESLEDLDNFSNELSESDVSEGNEMVDEGLADVEASLKGEEEAEELVEAGEEESEEHKNASKEILEGDTSEEDSDMGLLEGQRIKDAEEEKEAEGDAEAYVPEGKYKFKDEFFEFDEVVKNAIKSKEDEDLFKDLYSARAGMDVVKKAREDSDARYVEMKTNYDTLSAENTQEKALNDNVANLMTSLAQGDANALDKLLKASGVSEEALYKLGERLGQHIQNPQEYNRQLNEHRNMVQQQVIQQQQTSVDNSSRGVAEDATTNKINECLSDPEIAAIASAVDSKLGQGKFLEKVYQEGTRLQNNKQAPSIDKLPDFVRGIANEYKALGIAPVQPAAPAAQPAAAAPVAQAPAPAPEKKIIATKAMKKPTKGIPVVGGGEGVPVHTGYKKGEGIAYLDRKIEALEDSE